MRKRTAWTVGMCVAWMLAGPRDAQAQMAVIDVQAIVQLTQQISVLQDQLAQAQAQLQAMTGGRGMEALLAGTVRNYLPPDWESLQAALNGLQGGYGAFATQLDATLRANAVLTADQVSKLSTEEREQLEAARKAAALLQVTSRQALGASSERFTALQRLIDAIPYATDQKAVLDLQARIAAEQAMLQNENTKLMVLYHAAQAEELAHAQRSQELAIANRGSLRQLGPVGLNE